MSKLQQRLAQDPGLPVGTPTQAYWQLPPAKFEHVALPEQTDVVIIGSGITGCSIAKRLLESDQSLRVTVIEARDVCSGATGRNGGHIKAVPEHTYADHILALGLERTREVMHFTLANVEVMLNLLPTLSPELQQDCEVRRVESLNIFIYEDMFEEFKGLVDAFEKHNPDLEGRGRIVSVDELRLVSNHFEHYPQITALMFCQKNGVHNAVGGYISSAGAAWPYRLITGIFSELLSKHRDRFTISARNPVESISVDGNGTYSISTQNGTIHTKSVIHATNGHAAHLLPGLRGALFPVRGQMTTQTPSDNFGNKYDGKRSWSIHYDAGFDYITQSGQTGEIFHGGGLAQSVERGLGELGNTRDDVNSVQAVAHLCGALNATFGIDEDQKMASGVKATWTGVMGFTSDKLPLVGRLPAEATQREGQGEWIAAGFNGYGMANAWLCGQHIADSVLGKDTVEPVPQAYVISSERLDSMSAKITAQHWLAVVGMD